MIFDKQVDLGFTAGGLEERSYQRLKIGKSR